MRKIYFPVKITNYEDIARSIIKEQAIRKVELKARIDSGATHVAFPDKIAKELGLRVIDRVKVRYANGKIEEKPVGSVIEIEILGRKSRTCPIIEANDELIIGNPILEELDILINTKTGEFYINPESPDMPVAELL
ncbi:MAG: retropepsin-like aspartic protease [bacterium]|nr:retropepsin-like aspartic protease [bacterium]